MITAYAVLGLVVLQRLGELWYSARNTRALKAAGGVEHGHRHYPVMVLLHAAWLTTIAAGIARDPAIRLFPLVLFLPLQFLRLWVLATLGPYWTTRVITLPGAPLVRRGPYRFLRHPNYLIVVGEVAILPLVFGQALTAIVFSLANGALLAWRIRIESAALAPRQGLPGKDRMPA